MDRDRLAREAAWDRPAPGHSPDPYSSINGGITRREENDYAAFKAPSQSKQGVPEGNLIELDSPPSTPKLIKIERSEPQIKPHTYESSAKPAITALPVAHEAAYPKLSQGQRGYRYPSSGATLPQRSNTRSTPPPSHPLSARSKWISDMKPDCVVQLGDYNATDDASIASLFGRTTAGRGRTEIFDDVCRKTGVFIKPPVESDTQLFIWGNRTQVDNAKTELQNLVIRHRDRQLAEMERRTSPGSRTSRTLQTSAQRLMRHRRHFPGTARKPLEWDKIGPYHSIEQMKRKQEYMVLAQLRREPEGLECTNKLVFTWPTDGPSPQECLGADLEKLDGIRTDLQVYAYLDPENPAHIVVSNNGGFDSAFVLKFLRAAWKEGMGRTDLHVKKLMLAPVPLESSMYAVTLVQHKHVAKPFLHGIERQDACTGRQVFAQKMNAMQASNFKEIVQNMRTSLSMVNYFNGNLRMRFHFGTLILDRFKNPKNNESAFNLFDFAAMIGHDQCRGRVVPGLKIKMGTLLNRFRDADDLLEPIGQTRSLSELGLMEPTHAATIEFLGSPGSDFRLELYLKRIARAGEVEIKGHRWFKARHGEDKTLRMPLQLAMMDFGRADWQCDIEFFEVAAERQLSKSQRELASSIRFTSTGDNHHFVSHAAMNIWIPKDTPDAHIVKKSAIRFKVKGTNLILELARFDVYRMTNFIKSYSSASLYNPDWDSLMGGEIGVGGAQAQPYGAGLEAFFPSGLGGNAEEGAGLAEVIYVVQKIAELMGGYEFGLSKPPKDEKMAAWMDVELGTLF